MEEGEKALQEGDYETAFKIFYEHAIDGDATAQLAIGLMYANGLFFTQDSTTAFKWCLKAAKKGLAEAEYIVGYFYFSGGGVQQDGAEALKWFILSAEKGLLLSQEILGRSYLLSDDTPNSIKWYTKAAEQNSVEAQKQLGMIYLVYGGEETKNVNEGIRWFKEAAKKGDSESQFQLGSLYFQGIDVPVDYVESMKWFFLAFENGNELAGTMKESLIHMLNENQLNEAAERVKNWKLKYGK